MTKSRKLAAIMFTDMVGFTRLVQEDEVQAKTIRDRHRTDLTAGIEANRGTIIQFYGDGTLSIFSSAIDAVNAGIAIQKAMLQDPVIPVRIGIHTGDIIQDEEGVFGDGVNVASRIESLAVSGSVIISEKVFDEIKNQKAITTQELGEFELKNVKRPITVYAITNAHLVVPKREEMQGKVKERIRSVAVMPFVNMSSDPDNEYFSDGVTEELINALAKVDGLQVTSRTSSFSFKGKNEDIRSIASTLNVQSILEGSVRKAGQKVRITAQLINATDGYHLWSETYDRGLEDIFEVQDEISRTIANRLRQKLSLEERKSSLVTAATQNMKAYNFYLRGLYESNKWTPNDSLQAIEYYKKAIMEEPEFSLPYGKLASDYALLGITGSLPMEEAHNHVLKYGNKGLELDPDDHECMLTLATVKIFMDWDWEGGLELILRAKSINPHAPNARMTHALYHVIHSNYEKGIEEMQEALKLDPLSTTANRTLADFYYFMGEYEKALEYYDKLLAVNPTFKPAKEFKAWTFLMMNKVDEAIAMFEDLGKETIHAMQQDTQLGYAYALKGDHEKANFYLQKVEERSAASDRPLLLDLATLHTGLCNFDEAFDYLNQCIDQRIGTMVFLHQSPIWKPLRSDKRYEACRKRVGLPG